MKSDQLALSDFCEIIQGGRLKLSGNDFVDQGFPAYGAGGLNGYLDVAEFDCEAVILSAIGARCGKCFHANGSWTSLANTQIIIPDPDRADSRFLWYQLNDEKRWPRSGTGQPFIKPSDVKRHNVCLPPLEEQRRIAAILDKVHDLNAKAAERSVFISALGRSLFVRRFGLPSENPYSLPRHRLIDICNPKQWPTISSKQLQEHGYPVFGANGLIGYFDRFNHAEPTVLVTCRGATCGTVNVSPPNCYVTGNSMAMDDPDPGLVTTDYLAWVLRLRGMQDVISGSAQPQITRQGLEAVTIPVPSLKAQNEFSGELRAVSGMAHRSRFSEASLRELANSMANRLFRGVDRESI